MEKLISFTLNGRLVEIRTDGEHRLLWVLRTELGLTGAKYGCGEGWCGSCSVLVDDKVVRSCQVPVVDVSGRRVTTVEGLAKDDGLHPLQEAFVKNDALQCGFCTPGMIITASDLLSKNPGPTRKEIVDGMNRNLCRCGAHIRIVQAIEAAAKEMKGDVSK